MKMVAEQLQKALDNQIASRWTWSDVYNYKVEKVNEFRRVPCARKRKLEYIENYERTNISFSKPSPTTWKYDIFVSFRGIDTRETFVKWLCSALVKQQVFKDELIPWGECIGPSLFKAIEESKIAIVIFSKHFADSDWCLNELEHIMKCKAERGLEVLPVFYHVDPSDVRRQKRSYRTAFSKHESENIDKAECWRKALVDAANLKGFVVTGDEEKAIDEIVCAIAHKYFSLMPSDKAVTETCGHTDLIGMETRMQDLKSLLKVRSGGVRMVGICGIWGAGKSALASSIYDEIHRKFQGCCFVQNVREESTMHGLKTLQEKILSHVIRSKVTLSDMKQGVSMMASILCKTSVLIVLDGVDHINHLKMLAGSHNWFGKGSRIIFTTRNQNLVNAHKCRTHSVRMLDVQEAAGLFCRHAFGARIPVEGYKKTLSQSIVSKLGGHPSALKSLGSFLHEKDVTVWTSTLVSLEGIPVHEILEKFQTGDDGISRDMFSWLLDGVSTRTRQQRYPKRYRR